MRSDPYIIVECDYCLGSIEIQLTTTVRGYDERGIDSFLTSQGWVIGNDDEDYCGEDCKRYDQSGE